MTSPASAAVRVSSGASLPLPPPGRRGATGFASVNSPLLVPQRLPEAGPSRFRSDSCSCWAAAARAADSPASNRKV
ncbi:hypothetical protein CHLRE_10g431602v5 [Chlamydomonas reinhardtii]|uniref:Uncharacterized protein n=1 Tax=Chlamydomonas reinhardtii TaxID=3055 RepID=A0A2K3D9W3_CHLRE|nr:uncharacterized protein CHLRE_10g431602v5 [Chlamydomonas reinhardtii]PNW77324.1 hypothetical protein CHLRE_10g431602v5 [Chlamydomonas reinhardtii]